MPLEANEDDQIPGELGQNRDEGDLSGEKDHIFGHVSCCGMQQLSYQLSAFLGSFSDRFLPAVH